MDTVIHDGAPNVGGAWASEAYSQSWLVLESLKLACEFLAPRGTFVTKIFRWALYSKYCANAKQGDDAHWGVIHLQRDNHNYKPSLHAHSTTHLCYQDLQVALGSKLFAHPLTKLGEISTCEQLSGDIMRLLIMCGACKILSHIEGCLICIEVLLC